MARICVFCASSVRIDPRFVELASEVGAAIAARGHDLVSGGGSISMMGAVAQAVRAGGRHTVGVIPQALVDLEVADHDADELIVTTDMRSRKGRMEEFADAFLTLPGGIGTLEELTEVWVSASLGMHAKPVVVLDPTGLYAPLHDLIRKLSAENFLSEAALDTLAWTTTIDEALDQIEARLGELPAVPAVIEQVESAP
ncbi:TIGR00730 family Rossman fold protein [Kineosporia rhizophila]|uniref:LOG family protein n=1 Tax=Kineosporia TaxID=49184 RepID=UPI001E5CB902|nr:TIGR00730 family Rossman fold protein [Kineosporia sp. NBRC 101677]MCE0534957.1 TIGR00730 family Rossman fold protein [Kineosporia rhizophila]GLY14761.1 cytokinin riboside 5'-monophosphate phosphoribohydrolase [Kineosporia sp. NBRC 101677]